MWSGMPARFAAKPQSKSSLTYWMQPNDLPA
jgi:hypothetical protein